MARQPNTDANGNAWSEQTKKDVWAKGETTPGELSSAQRKDKCGKIMKWSEHGNRNSSYGWEVDHINPVSNGGGDSLSNLQPLHWENNVNKGDSLTWKCP